MTRVLSKLQHYGLTTQIAKGFILGEVSLTEVCNDLGAEGLTDKRKVRHARERQMYKAYLKYSENVRAKYRMIPSRSILGFCVVQFRGIRLDGQYNGVN